MNQPEILKALEQMLPSIRETGHPEKVMLKYAAERNLSPAQLEKMANLFNISKSLSYYDKAPNRGGSFSLLDPAKLIEEYTAYETETPQRRKAASAATNFPGPSALEKPEEVLEKAASADAPEKVQRDELAWSVQVVDDSMSYFRDEIARLQKEAQTALYQTGHDLTEEVVNADIQYAMGVEDGKLVMEQIFGKAAAEVGEGEFKKRAFDASFRTDPLRVKLLKIAADVYDNMLNFTIAKGLRDDLQKSGTSYAEKVMRDAGKQEKERERAGAQGALDYLREKARAQGPRQWLPPDDEDAAPLDDKAPVDINFEGNVDWIDKNVAAPAVEFLKKVQPMRAHDELHRRLGSPSLLPGENKAQKGVDSARDEVARAVTLARLMQSDPIISEADPETVEEIYNTLQTTAPEIIRDPANLRLRLREALQYGAVPAHSQKEDVEIRKALADARAKERSLNSYSTNQSGGSDV